MESGVHRHVLCLVIQRLPQTSKVGRVTGLNGNPLMNTHRLGDVRIVMQLLKVEFDCSGVDLLDLFLR